jgi:hypothetical protein
VRRGRYVSFTAGGIYLGGQGYILFTSWSWGCTFSPGTGEEWGGGHSFRRPAKNRRKMADRKGRRGGEGRPSSGCPHQRGEKQEKFCLFPEGNNPVRYEVDVLCIGWVVLTEI